MALEVGSVFARAGLKVDDDGFRRFDRHMDSAERRARDNIKGDAKLDVDSRGFRKFGDEMDHAEHRSSKLGGALKTGLVAGAAAGAGALVGLGLGVRKATAEYDEARKVAGQTNAVIKSTGGVANVSAKDVDTLANSLSRKAGIDDEAIASGENVLLTFRDIRNEVGKGNDVFDQASKATLDMSVALGKDMRGSAIMVGKALNDPLKGITALGRAGVQFTDQQKAQIEAMVESGDKMGAQKMILAELNKEFKGSAEAQATPMAKVKVAVDNLFESVGAKLAPVIDGLATGFANLVTEFQNGEGTGGRIRDVLVGIGDAIGGVVGLIGDTIDGVREAFSGGDAASSGFLRSVKETFGVVVDTVKGIVADVVGAFDGMGDSVGIIFTRLRQVTQVAWTAMLAIARRVLPAFRQIVGGLATVIRGVIDVIAGLLSGDFSRVWDGLKGIVSGALRAVFGILRASTAPFREFASKVGELIGKGMDAAVDFVKALPGRIWGFLKAAVGKWIDFNVSIRKRAIDGIRDTVTAVIRRAKELPGDLWDAIKDGAGKVADFGRNIAGKARDAGRGMVSGVMDIARDLPGKIAGVAGDMVDRFVTGVARLPGRVKDVLSAVGGIASSVGNAIRDWVNEHTLFGDHIHVGIPGPVPDINFTLPALRRGGKAGPGEGGPAVVYGEGAKTEWWISQEGDRRQNVRWGVEALEELTGRNVAFFKSGGRKGTLAGGRARKRAGAATGEAAAARALVDTWETKIDHAERDYGQLERGFDQSEEEFLVEDGDGNLILNPAGINARSNELKQLYAARAKIKALAEEMRRKIAAAIRTARTAIRRLHAAIKATKVVGGKGKKGREAEALAERRREGYRKKIGEFEEAIGELGDADYDARESIDDYNLDLSGLAGENAAVLGTTAPEDKSGGSSPEDVAAAAAQQVAAFDENRAALFADYGSNVVAADRVVEAFASTLGQAAGRRFFGAGETDAGGGGDTVITQNITIAGTATDELTFAQRAAGAIKVAL